MEVKKMRILKPTQEYCGINVRLERKQDQKLYECNQCELRAKNTREHKSRDHSDYKVLCDQCGYVTNVISEQMVINIYGLIKEEHIVITCYYATDVDI